MSEARHVPPPRSGAPDPLIGRVIAGRFKITSLIARGGMGKVYRAEQSPLGRLCAVKVLNPNYNGDADPEFHRRFFREASVTSRITHPNSVTIFDYGRTDDDIYFMAMEYLEGKTLHLAIREGGVMHELRAGRIASQICRALREAHKLGVVHRDLKPANIFLTRPNMRPHHPASGTLPPASEEDEDFVKVLDFGLVKHLAERPEEQLTQTGLFMGSPKYMAPEQIQGGHVDERTDIYSLGIIMYEMLAGKVPFERASSVNILMAHVGEPPPPMREVNPRLVCSAGFEELVMACISKDPNQRFASMDHVLQAIRRVHGGSQTGQVAAVNVNLTGPYLPARSSVSPYMNQTPAYGARAQVMARHAVSLPPPPPTHPPSFGVARAPASNDVGTGGHERRPRSKAWVPLGVFVAAVLGGGLGMLAFRYTTSVAPVPTASALSSGDAAGPLPSSRSPVETPPSARPSSSGPTVATLPSATAAVTVSTDPSGASIREDSKELCAATPCDVVWKGDLGKTHKIVIGRAGFRPETRNVRAGDGPIHVKLSAVGGPGPRPPTAPAPGPSGFKDQPY